MRMKLLEQNVHTSIVLQKDEMGVRSADQNLEQNECYHMLSPLKALRMRSPKHRLFQPGTVTMAMRPGSTEPLFKPLGRLNMPAPMRFFVRFILRLGLRA